MTAGAGAREGSPPGRRAGAVVFALVLAEIVAAFELSMLYVALPRLSEDLGVAPSAGAWAITAYLLVAASSGAVGGRLGDMYGRRRVLVVVLILSAVGSIVSIIGDSLVMVVAGRALQGVAGAVMGLAFGLAREHLARERVGVALSMIGASALLAGSGGAIVSGVVLELISWRAIFIVAAGLALVSTVVTVVYVPRDPDRGTPPRLDLLGAVLLPVAVALVLIPITNARIWGWASPAVLGMLAVGLVVATLWVLWERRVESPIVDLSLLGDRQLRLVYLATFAVAAGALGGSVVVMNIVLQAPVGGSVGLGVSPAVAGVLTASVALIGYLTSPYAGRIAGRHGGKFVMIAGVVSIIGSLLSMLLTSSSLIGVVGHALLAGLGASLVFSALPNLVVECVREERTAEVAGTNTLVRNMGQAIATTIVAFAISVAPDLTTGSVSLTGVNTGLVVMLVLAVVALIASVALEARPMAARAARDTPPTTASR